MRRDPTEFRERFAKWKLGELVYENGRAIPGYKKGKDAHLEFVELMGPALYQELLRTNTPNIDTAYDNMLRQLAYESDYGRSSVAKKQHNYGGYGWNGKTYTTFKDDADFIKHYVELMNNRYNKAVVADSILAYGKALKDKGYYEDSLEHYTSQLAGMRSLSKYATQHKAQNAGLYALPKEDSLIIQLMNARPQFVPQSVTVRPPIQTDYSIQTMANPTIPATINSRASGDSPLYGGNDYSIRIPSIKEVVERLLFLGLPGYRIGKPGWDDTDLLKAILEWGEGWYERTQPAARSKVILKWNATGRKPEPESSQEYTKRRVAEETKHTWLSDAADVAEGIKEAALVMSPYTAVPYFGAKVGQDILNRNVGADTALNAAFATSPFMPKFILPKALNFVKNKLSGEKILDIAKLEAKKFDWISDDTYARWYFNGLRVPEFKFVWHGRGTNRGNPYDALRTYSGKDVGLHVTENKATAKQFAKSKGIVYEGVDYGLYPDAIYSDITTWTAKDWKGWLEKALQITPELEKKAMREFNVDVVDRDYGKIKSVRDIAKHYGILYKDVAEFAEKLSTTGSDWVEREVANKKFADYLRSKGVNFRYKNDFEGGGYQKPSLFISDPSSIRWIPEVKIGSSRREILPILNWRTGRIVNVSEPYEFSKYIPTLPLPSIKEVMERLLFEGLPGYRKGKPQINGINPTNAKFNDDGTFVDDITRVFDDLVVTPKGPRIKSGQLYKYQEPWDDVEFMSAITMGLNLLSPVHTGRALYNIATGSGYNNIAKDLFMPNAGLFTNEFYTNHPVISAIGNIVGDGIVGEFLQPGKIISAVDRGFTPWSKIMNQGSDTMTRLIGTNDSGYKDLLTSGIIRGNKKITRPGTTGDLHKNALKIREMIPEDDVRAYLSNNFTNESQYNRVRDAVKSLDDVGSKKFGGIQLAKKHHWDYPDTYEGYVKMTTDPEAVSKLNMAMASRLFSNKRKNPWVENWLPKEDTPANTYDWPNLPTFALLNEKLTNDLFVGDFGVLIKNAHNHALTAFDFGHFNEHPVTKYPMSYLHPDVSVYRRSDGLLTGTKYMKRVPMWKLKADANRYKMNPNYSVSVFKNYNPVFSQDILNMPQIPYYIGGNRVFDIKKNIGDTEK